MRDSAATRRRAVPRQAAGPLILSQLLLRGFLPHVTTELNTIFARAVVFNSADFVRKHCGGPRAIPEWPRTMAIRVVEDPNDPAERERMKNSAVVWRAPEAESPTYYSAKSVAFSDGVAPGNVEVPHGGAPRLMKTSSQSLLSCCSASGNKGSEGGCGDCFSSSTGPQGLRRPSSPTTGTAWARGGVPLLQNGGLVARQRQQPHSLMSAFDWVLGGWGCCRFGGVANGPAEVVDVRSANGIQDIHGRVASTSSAAPARGGPPAPSAASTPTSHQFSEVNACCGTRHYSYRGDWRAIQAKRAGLTYELPSSPGGFSTSSSFSDPGAVRAGHGGRREKTCCFPAPWTT